MSNATSVKEVDGILRRQGTFTGHSPSNSDRVSAWRKLGGLHDRAFTEPEVVQGNWVITRSLCDRCLPSPMGGHARMSDRGWVCLKHKRWLGDHTQVDLKDFGEVVVAERHWRASLTQRGIVVDCPLVLLAEEAATVGISKTVLEQRADRCKDPSPALLVYPETVRLARLLSRPSFLDSMLGTEPAAWKRATVEREVSMVLPDALDAEAWRALARVWQFVLDLQDVVRDGHLLGTLPDDRWNVLRLWSGFPKFQSAGVPQVDQLM
ncbi:hypothetical protein BJF86_08390 [Serinicoccus sp. CNJ-927]|uniref:hypothetical protein n=1 Tax=Serinicoccus sp. CNJ-927 TaxID=1904970 RepID=UPI0009656D6C|nr:hypothetical protein [Serinicoccus sp. CNJ-927]OLT39433.1 hypothetical protein BJF86_08390 [Serinicoccus sp. CNJ-927]